MNENCPGCGNDDHDKLVWVEDGEYVCCEVCGTEYIPYSGEVRYLGSVEEPEPMDDSMDGDATSALASAGWGMDEDYGPAAYEIL